MADQEKGTLRAWLHVRSSMRPKLRIAGWCLAAAVMLAILLANWPELGHRRAAVAMNSVLSATTRLANAQNLARPDETERELRQLKETIRTLSAEHDRLANRVAALERNLEDLTGSIALTQPTRRPTIDLLMTPNSQFGAPPQSPSQPPAADAPEPASSRQAPQLSAAPMSLARGGAGEIGSAANDNLGGKPHGIDLGSANTIEDLRILWNNIRHSQAAALIAGLSPVITVHDAAQPGSVELRLVAGPVPSALAAFRLCAALSAAGTACRTTTFDGQSLAAQ